MPHMAMELLKLTAQIDLVHVPYTGAAPAVNDLIGGHVQMMFANVPVLLGSIQSGKLRALAIGSKTRLASLPSVPTTAELGMPQVEADNWYGLVAPIATPPPVLAKIHAAATQALNAADVQDKLATQGALAVGNSSAEFASYVKSEIERWGGGNRRHRHQDQVSVLQRLLPSVGDQMIARAPSHQMCEAWEMQMHAGDEQAVSGDHVEHLAP
jgi:tripartite-type tricarboxylate transporter receptor subunit TctC